MCNENLLLKKCFFPGNSTHLIINTVSIVSPSICYEVMGLETMTYFIFLDSNITADTATMNLKDACSLEEKLWPT